MRTITFTEFRKQASHLLTEVEQGESFVIIRHGKPIAEITSYSEPAKRVPSWKRAGLRLQLEGLELSSAILIERDEEIL